MSRSIFSHRKSQSQLRINLLMMLLLFFFSTSAYSDKETECEINSIQILFSVDEKVQKEIHKNNNVAYEKQMLFVASNR